MNMIQDMGFEKDIKAIVREIEHPDRQTLMFSATWPPEIQDLARQFCSMAPIHIKIGEMDDRNDGGLTVNKNIEQVIHILDSNYDKYPKLSEMLIKLTGEGHQSQKMLIFCQTKKGVDLLERDLRQDRELLGRVNYEVRGIHGDKLQSHRDEIYRRFKVPITDGAGNRGTRSNILLATDVASRGLDVKDVDVVVNFDMPTCIEDYVHRIGRTGRAGATGVAHAFFTKKELSLAPKLVTVLRRADQFLPKDLLELKRLAFDLKSEERYRKWRAAPKRDNRLGDRWDGPMIGGKPYKMHAAAEFESCNPTFPLASRV